jgi:hypothetical protein
LPIFDSASGGKQARFQRARSAFGTISQFPRMDISFWPMRIGKRQRSKDLKTHSRLKMRSGRSGTFLLEGSS